ncbi:hypothetical protein BDV23DRAFT_179242 [Aspergillus alliaceus]|uniref:Uncharacterized protein n=1 Tax=Petromyces alliaceus TaxID=209559 RepID=A0A5N7CKU0_PETAA|nr:hypothetical protein BDV23DRAFT_179242 [Aspergillus alliaceus]
MLWPFMPLEILDFYRGMFHGPGGPVSVTETTTTQVASKAMRDPGPIDEAIVGDMG